ncbi:nucleoside hydrolase [Pseudonocardia sp. N23]|uniref:nucleoside hydrolase n=1 Tax=Pseudonocardia sp. N23 TaxID=1987376 RepID=UPI000C0287AB|nr:nucleoside hydrolase [Pseudonocardia sp. N23]GAY07304.1 inosine-uridine preferring nucleoside hydrolase [Pseudonocardia sp. N23]
MPVPMIIDTDPGVDDAFAIALALCSPEVDVRAVVATYGNVGRDRTFSNLRRILALAGRGDIPAAAGAQRPLVHPQGETAPDWHGADGLGLRADDFPAPGPADPRQGVELMADTLLGAAEPVTLVCLGPLTDAALLLASRPDLAPRLGRIVVMGGSMGAGNTRGAGEFNLYADPEAAHRVLTQPDVPVTLVPLDVTMACRVDGPWLDELAGAGPRTTVLVSSAALYRRTFLDRHGSDSVALHDTLAVLEATVPGTLRTTPFPLAVACSQGPERGVMVVDRRGGDDAPRVDVALDVDVPSATAEVGRRIRALG